MRTIDRLIEFLTGRTFIAKTLFISVIFEILCDVTVWTVHCSIIQLTRTTVGGISRCMLIWGTPKCRFLAIRTIEVLKDFVTIGASYSRTGMIVVILPYIGFMAMRTRDFIKCSFTVEASILCTISILGGKYQCG